MYGTLAAAKLGETEGVQDVGWWDALGGLAGVLGVLGFGLALHGLYRLRPDVFIDKPGMRYRLRGGALRPISLTLIVHNAGAAAVTIAAVSTNPGETRGRYSSVNSDEVQPWLTGPERPCRMESADTKIWRLDLERLVEIFPQPSQDWTVTAIWFERKRIWPWHLAKRNGRKIPQPARRTELQRRRRQVNVSFSTAPIDPSTQTPEHTHAPVAVVEAD